MFQCSIVIYLVRLTIPYPNVILKPIPFCNINDVNENGSFRVVYLGMETNTIAFTIFCISGLGLISFIIYDLCRYRKDKSGNETYGELLARHRELIRLYNNIPMEYRSGESGRYFRKKIQECHDKLIYLDSLIGH